MNEELDRLWREVAARISARTAELLVEHEDWPVKMCILAAMHEEVFLHGVPRVGAPPIGILGVSPIQRLRSWTTES